MDNRPAYASHRRALRRAGSPQLLHHPVGHDPIRGLRPGLPRDEAWGMAQEALRLLVPHARRRGRSVLLSLTYVAKALRVTAPPGAPDPVPADLDSILHAARREAAPAVCGE
ncbi:hypothetical protein VY88_20470 [Azospirillum thiophilum]|uniref:Uncharacterized protein n=1 Tax=Azospirillum thiophilum TaxID=528244 RepID=A0AAC8W3B6_9PROT|nr:hypothetical protein AL072_25500 [Azospirillum thiophilum]KJR63819.1 hypothetical protein VY88_20470 [Azospirillum thiophilum]